MSAVFNNFLLGVTALDVAAVEYLGPAQVQARQQVRLSLLLNSLVQGTGLYARSLREQAGSFLQLGKLPVLTKAELMARFDDWVLDPQITLPALREFLADPQRIAEPFLGRYVAWESSGSSGQAAIFVQDAYAMSVYDALESVRHSPDACAFCGTGLPDLQPRIAFVGVTTGHFASIVQMRRMQTLYPWAAQASCTISILEPLASVVQQLNAFGPTVLATYPSAAITLADEQARGALRIAPHAIWTGGETLSGSARARIARVMECPVRDHYGASEFLSIASECSHGRLHANTDWLILEPVDEKFRPVPPGRPSATTLLTHLGNRIQPLIRYDLGDRITVDASPCACGSAMPVIHVKGRNDPPLTLRGSKGEPVVLLPLALTTVLEEQAGLYEFQLHRRDAHTLELQVPQTGEQAAAALRRGCQVLSTFVKLQGGVAVRVTGRQGVAMQRGKSGKTPRVIAA